MHESDWMPGSLVSLTQRTPTAYLRNPLMPKYFILITLGLILNCRSIRADEDLVKLVVAGLASVDQIYQEGQFDFQSAVRTRQEGGVNASFSYDIARGTYRWAGDKSRVDYFTWKANEVQLQPDVPMPAECYERFFVDTGKESYHWLKDARSLVVCDRSTKRRMPETIGVGPAQLWFSMDGQLMIDELMDDVLPPSLARWIVSEDGDKVCIAQGQADKTSFYEFDFHIGNIILPLGYRSPSVDRKLTMTGEITWHMDVYPPNVKTLKFTHGTSEAETKFPKIAFSCGKLEKLADPESAFIFDQSSVPNGTQITHYRMPGVAPRTFVKGGVDPANSAEQTEEHLRDIADRIRGK